MRKLPGIQAGRRESAAGLVGEGQKHESAHKHVSGEALYVDDMPTPSDCLHAYAGFSTITKGRITHLDLSAVAAAEGVLSVLTLEDIPGITDIGSVFPGDPLMVNEGGEISFCGQVLFAVAASSYELARRAATLAKVEYEVDGDADVSIAQAVAKESYVRPSHTQRRGDAARAIANSAHKLEGEMHIGGQEQMYLEGQISLCIPAEDGGMLAYVSTQNPTEGQKLIAEVLNVPLNLVTVDTRRAGGGFGGKETNSNQWACLAALLARKTGKAVKMRLARADDMRATGKRHHFLTRYAVGFDAEGVIVGLDVDLYGGCGISPDLSDAIVDRAMFHIGNAYFLPSTRVTGHRAKTNTVSNTAFRGFGGPQGIVSIENIIDNIARVVAKDPLDVRKLNFLSEKGGRDTMHYGQKLEQHIIPRLVERLEKTSDYRRRREEIVNFNRSSPVLKKGISLTPVKFGISFTVPFLNQAGALIHVYTDGSIQVNHGGIEMGQGLYTKVAQVVASEFQVDIATINCTSTRTDKIPNASPTAASSGSDLNGMAALDAAQTIKQNLIDFAVSHFEVAEEDVQFSDNRLIAGDNNLSFGELAQLAYLHRVNLSARGFYTTPKIHYDFESGTGHPFFYFANGAAVSEVLVDTLTGEYRVLRVDICEDVGASLNPAIDIGQIEGAFIQGMGWLTTEELVWDEEGRLQTINPAGYKIPTIADTPPEFNVELFPDSPNVEATIYHSKAVGEPPLMLATSVWCALRDAVASLSEYRRNPSFDTPATPERVLAACDELRALPAINKRAR